MRLLPLLIALFSISAMAREPIVRYSVLLGTDLVYSRGDLDGKRTLVAEGEDVVTETISLPELSPFLVYALDLRAHVDASSVSFNLGLGFPEMSYRDLDEQGRFLRLGVEYQYHFRWPEALRPGIGLGYSFTSVRAPHASSGEYDTGFATHSGNGFDAVTSLGYYGWQHFGLEGAVRYRLAALGNVSTEANDFSELDETLWQGFGELALRAIFTF